MAARTPKNIERWTAKPQPASRPHWHRRRVEGRAAGPRPWSARTHPEPAEPEASVDGLREVLTRIEAAPARLQPGRPTAEVLEEHCAGLARKLEEKAQQLDQASASLREITEALKKTQRLAKVGSWVWHIKPNKVEWSEQMFQIFGLEPATFSGDLAEAIDRAIHPDDRHAVVEANEDIINGKPPRPVEYRVVWPDGTERIVWAEAGELTLDGEGRPELLSGIAQDVTERRLAEAELRRSMSELDLSRRALLSLVEDQKRAEAQVRRLNAELELRVRERTAQLVEANRELDAFAHSVSHDLRAPLRAIDGFAQILVEDYGPKLDEEGRRLCGVVSDSARNMGRLIDALLALSHVGRAALKPSAVDMRRMAAEMFAELATPADRARLDFRVEHLPDAIADPALMRLVWQNLIANAIKFTAKRERAVIEVGAIDEERQVVYFVRDTGTGFDMQYAERLFGAFQRLHSAQDFEGTGVGLAIVKRIVDRHGGRVWAEGSRGEGATFSFTCAAGTGR